jgi:hypothetical protein
MHLESPFLPPSLLLPSPSPSPSPPSLAGVNSTCEVCHGCRWYGIRLRELRRCLCRPAHTLRFCNFSRRFLSLTTSPLTYSTIAVPLYEVIRGIVGAVGGAAVPCKRRYICHTVLFYSNSVLWVGESLRLFAAVDVPI